MSSKYINWNDINDDDSDQEGESSSIEEVVVNSSIKRTESTPIPVQVNQSNIDQNLNKLRNSKGNNIWLYVPAFQINKFAESEKELRKSIDVIDKCFSSTKTGWNIMLDHQKAQKFIVTGLRTENFTYKFYFSKKNQQNLQRQYSQQQSSNINGTKRYKEKKEDTGSKPQEEKGTEVKPSKYKQKETHVSSITEQVHKQENKQKSKIQEKAQEQTKPKKKKYVAKKKQELPSIIQQQNQTDDIKIKNAPANNLEKTIEQNQQTNEPQKQQQSQNINEKRQQVQSKQKLSRDKMEQVQSKSLDKKQDNKNEEAKQQPKQIATNGSKVQQAEQQDQEQNLQKLKKKMKTKNKKNKTQKKQINDLGNNRFAAFAIN